MLLQSTQSESSVEKVKLLQGVRHCMSHFVNKHPPYAMTSWCLMSSRYVALNYLVNCFHYK